MADQRYPLTATEEAYVAMVLEEHAALVRMADQKRETRMRVLLDERQIPPGMHVTCDQRTADGPAHLVAHLP